MSLLVEAEGLGKDYRQAASWRDILAGRLRGRTVRALDTVSLSLAAGEVLVLFGMNGAGKSTLLKCLAGLVAPTRGRAQVCGHDCTMPSTDLRRDAVYVAADPRSFAWRLSGRANLEFFSALVGWNRHGRRRRVADALTKTGIVQEIAERRVSDYSAGMRQKLALARALLGTPRVFLLDEPTAGLDPRAAREHRRLIRSLAESGCAVLVATHLVEEAQNLGRRAIVLEQGRIVFSGLVAGAIEVARGC
ncbi:MAG: ABC transporter ATP-binding protein [Pseudomonadota bacterium]